MSVLPTAQPLSMPLAPSAPAPSPTPKKALTPHERVLASMEEMKRLMVADDGENMDSGWHYFALQLLVEIIYHHFRARDDFYAGANGFVYFSAQHVRNRDFRGPDFYFVNGVKREPIREYWCIWEEGGRYPDLIVELLSPTTAELDRGVKKDTYEKTFRTPEFFCYDPDSQGLQGWRLDAEQAYQPIAVNDKGWMWSERVGLWLGTWTGKYQGLAGTWLRFLDAQGQLVPTREESATAIDQQRLAEQQRAEVERQRADDEQQRAEVERQRADDEQQRADVERQRANALAEEVARLRALLEGNQPKD